MTKKGSQRRSRRVALSSLIALMLLYGAAGPVFADALPDPGTVPEARIPVSEQPAALIEPPSAPVDPSPETAHTDAETGGTATAGTIQGSPEPPEATGPAGSPSTHEQEIESVPGATDVAAPIAEAPSDIEPAAAIIPDDWTLPDPVDIAVTPPTLPVDRLQTEPESEADFAWRFDALLRAADDDGEPEAEAGTENVAELHAHLSPTTQIVRDRKVERHLNYFNGTIRHRFDEWLKRFGQYRPMVEQIFTEFGLPIDLAYLSLVESGFNPRAYSRARATGPWQFMKGTGKLYGLRINYYIDERRDPIKSTVAAARYLRDLYDLFGTWPLAMAAYNAGEGKVGRALRRSKSESFREIARTRYIRRETKEYVPRFMAATIIASNPDQYGFSSRRPDPHQFDEVVVSRPLHLRDIARAAHISYPNLRTLNPELRRYVTPPRDKDYHLKVPVGSKAKIEAVLDQIPSWKKSTPPRMKGNKVPKGWYRVQLGDSLWKIAKRFRVSVRELKARNNIRGRLIRPGDLLAIR